MGFLPRGERHWEDGWLNRGTSRRLRKSYPHPPTSRADCTTTKGIPGTVSHWTEEAGRGARGSGPALEQNTMHWALAVFLICCWCVGVGAGVGQESDAWIFVSY